MQTSVTLNIESDIYNHPIIQAQIKALNETIKFIKEQNVLDDTFDELESRQAKVMSNLQHDPAKLPTPTQDDINKVIPSAFQPQPDISNLLSSIGPLIANFSSSLTQNPEASQALIATLPIISTAVSNLQPK